MEIAVLSYGLNSVLNAATWLLFLKGESNAGRGRGVAEASFD